VPSQAKWMAGGRVTPLPSRMGDQPGELLSGHFDGVTSRFELAKLNIWAFMAPACQRWHLHTTFFVLSRAYCWLSLVQLCLSACCQRLPPRAFGKVAGWGLERVRGQRNWMITIG
jgi:hypothetical protein